MFRCALVLAAAFSAIFGCERAPSELSTPIDQAALKLLSQDAQAAVARAPMPVLLPRDPRLLARGTVVAEESFFAFSFSDGGLSVSVQATRIAHVYPDIPPLLGDRLIRGTRGFVTEVERVREASWIENGASYVLDVECFDAADPRCTTERFLLDTAETLTFVGPAKGVKR